MTRLLLVAAVLLAAAGVGAGTPIQDAIDDAGEGDMICVHAGTNARECGCEQATYA